MTQPENDSPDMFDSLPMDLDASEAGPRLPLPVPLHELSQGQINCLDAYRYVVLLGWDSNFSKFIYWLKFEGCFFRDDPELENLKPAVLKDYLGGIEEVEEKTGKLTRD